MVHHKINIMHASATKKTSVRIWTCVCVCLFVCVCVVCVCVCLRVWCYTVCVHVCVCACGVDFIDQNGKENIFYLRPSHVFKHKSTTRILYTGITHFKHFLCTIYCFGPLLLFITNAGCQSTHIIFKPLAIICDHKPLDRSRSAYRPSCKSLLYGHPYILESRSFRLWLFVRGIKPQT
jgi:hypothetical protein